MTERAVREAYLGFLERMTAETLGIVEERFGGGLLGRVAKRGASAVARRIEAEMRTQGRVVVGYAAALAAGADDTAQFDRRFLETNPVFRRYDGPREAELRAHLLEHFHAVGADLAPLVAADCDDFWPALREEYTREEAEAIVDRHFSQADTFTEYKDGVFASERLGDRVVDVIEEAERRLRERLYAELDRTYDGGE